MSPEAKGDPWHREVITVLNERYDAWDFAEHTDSENVQFAHNLVTWVSDMFPFFSDARSEEFSGELLTENLKPLVSHIWRPKDETHLIYSKDLFVRVFKREEHTVIDPQIEDMDEMMAEGLSFEQIVKKVIAESLTIIPGQVVSDPAIGVLLYDGLRAGLEFMVEPDYIYLSVFGESRATRKYSQYLLRNHEKQTMLAQNAAKVAILGAERADYCMRNDMNHLLLTEFDKRLFGYDLGN